LPNLKLRLGFVNSQGEQKGVDSLIITDMISLARNRAIADAVLLSGDEDLRVGVQQAQEYGVRVHVLGFKPARGTQSQFLLQEADTTHEWVEAQVAQFVTCQPKNQEAQPAVPPSVMLGHGFPTSDGLKAVAAQLAGELKGEELEPIIFAIRNGEQIPGVVHGKLLAKSRAVLKADLDPRQKKEARRCFLEACEARLTSTKGK
jgi:hypothetical protein